MSREILNIVAFARSFASTNSAPFMRVVEPEASPRENQWCTRPSAPVDSQPNSRGGVICVMVLFSRWVPNRLATVEPNRPAAFLGDLQVVTRPFAVSTEVAHVREHVVDRRIDRDALLPAFHATPPPGLNLSTFNPLSPDFGGESSGRRCRAIPSRPRREYANPFSWEGQDSNLRRLRRRFYRPLPLAARAPSRVRHNEALVRIAAGDRALREEAATPGPEAAAAGTAASTAGA